MSAFFSGTCEVCFGLSEHFDWCPLLADVAASAPAAPDPAVTAAPGVGAASGDVATHNRPGPSTPGAAEGAADTARDGA